MHKDKNKNLDITDAKVSTRTLCFCHLITGFLLDNEFKWNKIAFVLSSETILLSKKVVEIMDSFRRL